VINQAYVLDHHLIPNLLALFSGVFV